MVETITPVVHGGRARWARAVVLHALGATVTAVLFGAALGAVGSRLGAPWGRAGAIVVAGLALVYALGELPRASVAVPQLRRQVPDWWRTYFGTSVAAFLYGAGLGVGFLTFLTHGTLVVVAAAALAIGDPLVGAVVVGVFGLARGAAVVISRSIASEEDGVAVLDELVGRSDDRRRLANGTASLAVAALAVVVATRVEGGWGSLAVALVAGTFAWSAAAKLTGPRRWRRALEGRGLPSRVARVARWGVPAVEVVVPMLALLGMRRASAAVALGLLLAFSAEIVRVRLVMGRPVPCGCFGGRSSLPASTELARNAALGAVAIVALAAATDVPVLRWPGAPSGADVIPATLAAVGLCVAMLAVWRSTSWLTRGGHA
jgi:hypothetical protein